ncbi:lipoprotein insertase outer membrane protein LolB [Noviherbaspirillum soli]|uniref:lipoprotein insertase outer membrane protein LolB n=1 Tax=Noviherbaspirillum soli TaxID=1064518 RepID=UPI001889E42E|nr:lipoprotein insertase outer membrane protein LolB [Noviherbaspirillum soli]
MTFPYRAALLALPIFLAACAGVPPAAPVLPESSVTRAYQQSVDINGRMSVRYQINGRDEALHGSFEWRQRPDNTQLTLLSPLGQTLAQIMVTPDGATLTQAGQPPLSAADADALASQALGWPLPVAGLRDWLQGMVTVPGGKRVALAPGNDGDIVSADGWRLRFPAWEDGAPARPRRIDLARSTEQAGDVALRLVIDSFQPR